MAESPFRKAAMQQLADLLLPTIPESFQDLGQRAAGRAEVLATLGTGMAGSIPAGYGGLLELARTGDPQAAAQLTQEIQQGLTYMPRTEMGQEYLQEMGGPLEMLAAPSEAIGQATLEATGSPLTATAAETFGDPLEYLLPGLKGVMATAPLARRAMRASDGAMKASDIGVNVPDEVLDQVAQEKIIAFHGSPYEFEKFDMSQIGTGEGAQAYGYGLYFAEAEDVAKGYRKELTGRDIQKKFQDEIPDDADFEDVMQMVADGKFTDNQAAVIKALENDDWLGFDYPSQAINAAYRNVDRYDPSPELMDALSKEGATYRVEIDAKPEELLDWDKPLSEQPEKVQKAFVDAYLEKVADQSPEGQLIAEIYKDEKSPHDLLNLFDKSKGSQSYNTFAGAVGGPEEASRLLRNAGIKGIKYADGMSRNKEGGTSNFVVFDDRLISIAEKYGVALPVAGAILYQLEQQSQPIESI